MHQTNHQDQELLQNGCLIAERSHYTVLKASGSTVRDYLQGQVTQEIALLTPDCGIYTALLTPQGKAVSDLYIIEGHGGELILLVPTTHAETVVGRLRQFALGHELRIGIVDSLKLLSLQGERAAEFLAANDLPQPATTHLATARIESEEHLVISMPEASDIGFWIVTNHSHALKSSDALDENSIINSRIIKGFPTFGVDWDESVFPLNANLIEMQGVNFDKGCYVGQEVTSRMQWRGGIKKRLYRVKLASSPAKLPSPISTKASTTASSTAKVGNITSAAADAEKAVYGIAHLPIEVVENSAPLIDSDGHRVEVIEACHV